MKIYCVLKRDEEGRVQIVDAYNSERKANLDVLYYRSLEELETGEDPDDIDEPFHRYWYQEVEIKEERPCPNG